MISKWLPSAAKWSAVRPVSSFESTRAPAAVSIEAIRKLPISGCNLKGRLRKFAARFTTRPVYSDLRRGQAGVTVE